MVETRRILGEAGEHIAEKALRERGWAIVARNARTRYGEIDLVCHDGRAFVFVEVKTRKDSSFVSAVEACGPRKIRRLVRLSEAWLALHGSRDVPWRPAVLAITFYRARPWYGKPPRIDMRLLDVDPLDYCPR